MRGRLGILLLCVILTGLLPQEGSGRDAEEGSWKEMRELTVHVLRITGASNCSGVLIDPVTVLTAAHCTRKVFADGSDEVTVLPDGRKAFRAGRKILVEHGGRRHRVLSVVVLKEYHTAGDLDPSRDVALLRLASRPGAPVVGIGASTRTTPRYVAYGFQLTTTGLSRSWRLESCQPRLETVGTFLRGVCGLRPGASGGPLLYTKNGIVYTSGVLSTVSPDGTNTWAGVAAIEELINEGVRIPLGV